jgi:pimeloyl-ACP methyl ester carboxylesterase
MGATVGYVVHGHGPIRVLALHGWLGDSSSFEPLLPAIDERRFTLACIDYRGYGSSRSSPGPFDINTIAQDAATVADGLQWDSYSVVGHSMGGKAALRLALNVPQRVRSILAITPVWAGKVPFDEPTLAVFRGAAAELSLREAIISNTTGGRLPPAWSRHIARDSAATALPEAFAAYFDSWALDDFADAAATLQIRTTVVVGAHDRSITRDVVMQTWLARLPNASLTVLAEAGHYPMLECPPALGSVFEAALPAAGV